MILVYCENEHGQVAFPSGIVEGVHTTERKYSIHDHFVEVSGDNNGVVAAKDAEELCTLQGYRLASPVEMDLYRKHKRAKGKLHE